MSDHCSVRFIYWESNQMFRMTELIFVAYNIPVKGNFHLPTEVLDFTQGSRGILLSILLTSLIARISQYIEVIPMTFPFQDLSTRFVYM